MPREPPNTDAFCSHMDPCLPLSRKSQRPACISRACPSPVTGGAFSSKPQTEPALPSRGLLCQVPCLQTCEHGHLGTPAGAHQNFTSRRASKGTGSSRCAGRGEATSTQSRTLFLGHHSHLLGSLSHLSPKPLTPSA